MTRPRGAHMLPEERKQGFRTEGRKAHQAGLSQKDCPYPVGSYQRNDWRAGWVEENLKAEARERGELRGFAGNSIMTERRW